MTDPWWTALAPSNDVARGRRHTVRAITSGAAVAVVAAATIGASLAGPTMRTTVEHKWGLSTEPSVQAIAAGCGPLHEVTNPSSEVAAISPRTSSLPYDTTVPAAGWFYENPPAADDPSPAPEAVLRAMWAGEKVAWYSPDAPASIVAQLRSLAAAHPQWRMRVAPWPSGRENLSIETPDGGPAIAFATWGATQTCEQVRPELAEAVWQAGTPAPGEHGGTPPKYGQHGRV